MSLTKNPILEYMETLREQEKQKETKKPTPLPSPGFPSGTPESDTFRYDIPPAWDATKDFGFRAIELKRKDGTKFLHPIQLKPIHFISS